jgi:hypothetical protein
MMFVFATSGTGAQVGQTNNNNSAVLSKWCLCLLQWGLVNQEKHMFRILMHGFILNLHIESLLFYQAHTNTCMMVCRVHVPLWKEKRRKNPHLERQSLDYGGESPSLMVPCLKPTPQCAPSLPSPLYLLTANETFIYTQTTLTCSLLLSRAQFGLCH